MYSYIYIYTMSYLGLEIEPHLRLESGWCKWAVGVENGWWGFAGVVGVAVVAIK